MAIEHQQQAPTWAQELIVKYQSAIAHAFILHGNVQDYISGVPGMFLREYLIASFKNWDVIVSWNNGTGIHLPSPEQEKLFANLVEFPVGATAGPQAGGLVGALNQTAGGAVNLTKALGKTKDPKGAIEYINRLMRVSPPKKQVYNPQRRRDEERAMKFAAIVDYAEALVPNTQPDPAVSVTLSEIGRDERIGDRENIVILITNDLNGMDEQLRKSGMRWEKIEIPFPELEERARFFEYMLTSEKPNVQLADGITYQDLARLTQGMRYLDLKDIVLKADYAHQPLSQALVKARKDEIMASEFDEVLTVGEHDYGFESIGGMQEVKGHLIKTVIQPMRNGKLNRVPSGILLQGPAGTGKTRLARALAKEAGFTFVELQPAKIHSKWLGDSQRRLERALSAIMNMTPCIVFVDEIDQAFGRGEGSNSEAYNNVFKRLMEVMADKRNKGKVLWIGATNRADLIDAALLRRLSKKIPILATEASERQKVLEVITRDTFADEVEETEFPSSEQYQEVALSMDGYTGAEIEGVLEKAVYLYDEGLSIYEALKEACDRIVPTTRNVDLMTELALRNCNDIDLVPPQYHELFRKLHNKEARETQLEDLEEETAPRRSHQRSW